MRASFLFALLFYLGFYSRAQTDFRFADSTAQWNVFVYSDETPATHMENYYYNNDAIWQNRQYQNISGTLYRRDSLNRIYTPHPWDTTASDGLLYDFSANPGDTIFYKRLLPGYTWYSGTLIVDSTDTVYWDKPRRRLFLKTLYGDNAEVWIDGIGVLNANPLWHVTSYNPPGFGFNTIYNLLCFHENGQLVYQDANSNSCNTAVQDLPKVRVDIYPNPAEDVVSFQLPDFFENQQALLQISTPEGQSILNTPFHTSLLKIPTTTFARGMYFYSIISKGQKAASGKIILQ